MKNKLSLEFKKLSKKEFVRMFIEKKEEPPIPFIEKDFHEWGDEEKEIRKKHLKW